MIRMYNIVMIALFDSTDSNESWYQAPADIDRSPLPFGTDN